MSRKFKNGLMFNSGQLYDEELPNTPVPTASQLKKLNADITEAQTTFRKMKDGKTLSTEPSGDEFNKFTFPEEKKKSKIRYADSSEETECSPRKKIKVSLNNSENPIKEDNHKKKKDVLHLSSSKLECETVTSTNKKKHKKHRENEQQTENNQGDDSLVSLENEVITKKKKKKKRKSLEDTNTNFNAEKESNTSNEYSLSNDTNSVSPRKKSKKHKKLSLKHNEVEDDSTTHILKEKTKHNIESEQNSEEEIDLESNNMSKEAIDLLKHLKQVYDEYKTKCNLSDVNMSFVKRKKKKKRKIVKDVEEAEISKINTLQHDEVDDENNVSSKKSSKRKHNDKVLQSDEQDNPGSSGAYKNLHTDTNNSDDKPEERKKKKKHKKAYKETQDLINNASAPGGKDKNIQGFEYVNVKTELEDSLEIRLSQNEDLKESPTLNDDIKSKKKKKKKNKEHLNESDNICDIPTVIEENPKNQIKPEIENFNDRSLNLNEVDYNIDTNQRTKGVEVKVFNSDDETSDEGVEDDDFTFYYNNWQKEDLTDDTFKSLKQLNICLPFIPPPIHNIETRMSSRPTKEQVIRFDNLDIEIVKGKYSKSEDEMIQKNWEELCKSHDIDPDPTPFLNFIHGSSGSKTSLLSLETRKKFVQYLARGLNDRMLWSVYKRFQNLYSKIHKGRFSADEDKIVVDFMKKHEGNHRTFSTLAKMLNRDRLAIEKRYRWLKKVKLLCPTVTRVSKSKKIEIVQELLQVTNLQDVEGLKDREILPEEWEKVALKVGMTPHGLKTKWKVHLRDRLFLKETDINDIGRRLVDLIYEDDVDDFRKITFKKYMPHFNSCSNGILYYVFRQLVHYRVPNEYRDNLKDTLEYLKNEYFQKKLRPSNIRRIILPEDLIN